MLSTPMITIHWREIDMEDEQTQLLLNYWYSHLESVFLWLIHGPLIKSFNHSPSREPNNLIQWHSLHELTDNNMYNTPGGNDDIEDSSTATWCRKSYQPELLIASPVEGSWIHDKGLVMDLVSAQPMELEEKVVINYGDTWVAEWDKHQIEWATKEWSQLEEGGQIRCILWPRCTTSSTHITKSIRKPRIFFDLY